MSLHIIASVAIYYEVSIDYLFRSTPGRLLGVRPDRSRHFVKKQVILQIEAVKYESLLLALYTVFLVQLYSPFSSVYPTLLTLPSILTRGASNITTQRVVKKDQFWVIKVVEVIVFSRHNFIYNLWRGRQSQY